MAEAAVTKIGGIQGRITVTVFYGMLCALEIRGYLALRAGQTVLDVPQSWMIAFGAFCVWLCWMMVVAAYRKGGITTALTVATFECLGSVDFLHRLLIGIAGRKILQQPPDWQIALYTFGIFIIIWGFFIRKRDSKKQPGMSDSCAWLMVAVLFATKIGIRYATEHRAIALKGIGCIALGIGMILMLLGLLNALSPEESEFSAIQNSSLDVSSAPSPKP